VTELSVQEQWCRDRAWVIVKNTVSGQFVRVEASLWQALRRLQGTLSLRDWLHDHADRFPVETLLESASHLQRQGLLSGLPDRSEMPAPARRRRGFNPLMIRIPLFNPSRLLARLAGASEPVAGRSVLVVAGVLVITALLIAIVNQERLLAEWHRVLAAPEHWWQYLFLYPCLKCLHELAHGLALKRLGGDVTEAGFSMLVLMPIPYVDATDVWSLCRRRDRLLVSAAGMLSDVTLASLAVILWLALQPGVLTDMAFALSLMSVLSIVMFNANPLLKFDGYYLLEDLLDCPGLARRSVVYWQYLFKRYLFHARGLRRPLVLPGERRWLLSYGLASLSYRCVISLAIAWYLIAQLHEIGVLLALFAITPMFVTPLLKLVRYLAGSTQLAQVRAGASGRFLLLCLLIITPVVGLPVPSSTRTEGMVWVPEQAELFAPEQGDIQRWHVRNGEAVSAGQLLAQLASPTLVIELHRSESQLAQSMLEHGALQSTAPERALSKIIEIERLQERVTKLHQRIAALTVRSPFAGRIAFADDSLVTGQRVKQGQLLAYVVDDEALLVRAVVDQRQLGRVTNGIIDATVRLADDIVRPLPARLVRQLPAGDRTLPSTALADAGFGGFDVESTGGTLRTREEVFHLELALTDTHPGTGMPRFHGGVGGRAFITLQHPPETLGERWWRGARQLLLRYLDT
jgi:putative peptide zinc metalloprotease protein